VRLAVALIRDLRQRVPVVRASAAADEAQGYDDDLESTSWLGWKPGWVATATPAAPTEAKLIPIVTTASAFDPIELVQVYTHRWPAQENSLRDYLISLGLDTNHGYAKRLVENSEVAKSRAVLERKLSKAQRQAQAARERRAQAEEHSRKLEKRLKRERAEATRTLTERLQKWEEQGVWELRDSSQTGSAPTAEAKGRRCPRCGLCRLRAGLSKGARPVAPVGRPGGERTGDV
jgi:hypothetical protein